MSGPESVDEAARCPRCDAEVAPPGRFCVHCGATVVASDDGRDDGTDDGAGDGTGDGADDGTDHGAGDETDAAVPGADAAVPGAAAVEGTGVPAAREGTERGVTGDLAAVRSTVQASLPPPASGRGATRRCSSCGQVNARSRELCRACGLDLDPSDRTAVPPRPAWRGAEPVPVRSRLRRWALVPSAALVVAVAITAGLWWAGLGPFAVTEEPLPALAFPAERYDGPATRLELSDIGTLTSAAPEGDRIFTPAQMVDDDPATAWRGEAPALPDGAPETIDVALAAPAWVSAVVVANGDHRDASAYEASGRVQQLELHFDGDLRIEATLLDLGRTRQVLELPEPVLTVAVRLVVRQALPGVEHPEPALAGLELWGHLADADDASIAGQRAEQRPAIGVLVTERPSDLVARHRAGQGS